MDIKLRARLSAYSKVSSVTGSSSGNSIVPTPTLDDAGNVLGVSDTGKYQFVPHVTADEIDTLFTGMKPVIETVTKDEIDELFESDDVETTETVSHADIDSLFQ